jgi:hypothetical protein
MSDGTLVLFGTTRESKLTTPALMRKCYPDLCSKVTLLMFLSNQILQYYCLAL